MIETLNKLGIEENPQFEKGNKNLQITLCLKIDFFLAKIRNRQRFFYSHQSYSLYCNSQKVFTEMKSPHD